MWRPKENWENPYGIKVYGAFVDKKENEYKAFEAGADAGIIRLIEYLRTMSVPAMIGFITAIDIDTKIMSIPDEEGQG